MAVGFDLGTSNLVAARMGEENKAVVKRLRNAFIEIDEEQESRLALGGLDTVRIKDAAYIVGDEAISIARILNKQVRRPMSSGILNPEEREGRSILSALTKALVGEPGEEFERCCFSVPAVPVDRPKANTVWHQGFFSALLEKLGYEAEAVNEALAIIYSDCADSDHCGIAISHGAGQVNVCASYKLVGTLEFSIARAGDWIDENSAAAIGTTPAKVLKIKEDPDFDLMEPTKVAGDVDDIGSAIMYHYRSMIRYELQHLVREWAKLKNQLDFPDPIPIVLSGGTALVKGFKQLWEEEFERFSKRHPLPFKVKGVRMAKDPLGAVARGLLTYALA